jgi:hypothetical protein
MYLIGFADYICGALEWIESTQSMDLIRVIIMLDDEVYCTGAAYARYLKKKNERIKETNLAKTQDNKK